MIPSFHLSPVFDGQARLKLHMQWAPLLSRLLSMIGHGCGLGRAYMQSQRLSDHERLQACRLYANMLP